MPGKGYSTIGLKPVVISRLQSITDTYYPGMFLPSTLIIIMNEVKKGYYSVTPHKIKIDLSGRYTSVTIRSDVKDWLEANYTEHIDEYNQRYHVDCFTKFLSYFMVNLFESKFDTQKYIIKLKESDFDWLQDEYKKRQNQMKKLEIQTFERFADIYLNELLEKVKTAKSILTT